MREIETPVLIVGASLVGMSTAMLLGHHGVRSMAVERHRGTAIHPRAAQISQRTMEIFRTVGIEQIVRKKSGDQFVQDGAIMAVESLAGKEIAWFIANLNEGVRDVSPTERVFISQSLLEPLLKERAEALGAELRFGVEMVSFEQTPEGVTAVIRERDTDRTQIVHARYLIAADGAHSASRERLRIAANGRGSFSNSITIYFRADVRDLLRGRNLSVIYVTNPALRGFLRFEKPFDSGFLAINALGDPANPITDVSSLATPERCLEWIQLALGSEKVPITIENVMPWKATAEVATRFQDGRVFFVGDAAHVMPPNGGFGGNTGVQDAHNLAWKLALALHVPSDGLLATYDAERRPVAVFTAEQAYSRYVTRTAPYLGVADIEPVVNDLNVELGYSYRSTAIISEPGDAPAHENPRDSKGRPGTRAPHVWFERNGERLSTLDLFGKDFVLLTGPDATAWRAAARTAELRVPLKVETIAFPEDYGITPDGAALIRPDGFVAWRGPTNENATAEAIERTIRTVLA